MLAGVTGEVLEGVLVRLEKLAQPLIGERAEEAAARESEREHEQVLDHHAVPEPHTGLPPVDLALLTRRRLETGQRPLGLCLQPAKRTHEALRRDRGTCLGAVLQDFIEYVPEAGTLAIRPLP